MSDVENPRKTEYPKIVSRAEWLRARKELLVQEKASTRYRDAVNAERRRLPMVRIEKDYIFDGPAGKVHLLDLFGERRQLIVYHFARGTDLLAGTYNYLDLTALGRQEDWEEPRGRSDGPFMHWIRHHDRYERSPEVAASGCGVEKGS